MKKFFILLLTSLILESCNIGVLFEKSPNTLGDPLNAKFYGYHPLDPIPVEIEIDSNKKVTNEVVLRALTDETIRLAVRQKNSNGDITLPVGSIGYAGNDYEVILDYVKYNTVSLPVLLTKDDGKELKALIVSDTDPSFTVPLYTNPLVIVPVYIGVGLRLTANISVKKGTVNLGNLFSIGIEASSDNVSGTLVVQTLGITGENISNIIPMPNELNPTTIQNSIMALGTIKSKIYDKKTIIRPRVVGVYNSLGGGTETINEFISSLLKKPLKLKVSSEILDED